MLLIYILEIKFIFIIKFDEFYIKVCRCFGKDYFFNFSVGVVFVLVFFSKIVNGVFVNFNLKLFFVFYGGNLGICKFFVEDFEINVVNYGLFVLVKVQSLDDVVENLLKDYFFVIVIFFYEGFFFDNVCNFVVWFEICVKDFSNSEFFKGVLYVVFGVGNKDWVLIYYCIFKLVDEFFEKFGVVCFVVIGFVDVSQDIVGFFEEWKLIFFFVFCEVVGVMVVVKMEEF